MSKTIYLTTPLYYVNAAPHIGHSYTTVAADCLARYHRLRGHEVFLLTGTDEHGQKIAQAAAAAGKPPQVFVDEVVEHFKGLWQTLDIQYDDFVRTTQPRHVKTVQAAVQKLFEEKKLTRATYQGWYCTPDETFWTEGELAGAAKASSAPPTEPGAPRSPRGGEEVPVRAGAPACPTCQRPLESAKEEGWYLRLRDHRPWLRQYLAEHPEFVRPQTRYNELRSLLEQPLPEYLCITRPKSRVAWGIEVPFSPDHVVYVWIDALLNYISVPGFVSDPARFATLWPADVHFIGKDILRHHALYWPVLLRELDLPLPKTIFAHGWWRIGEQKMSKSLGNIVDPAAVVGGLLKGQPYAADAYRYFLLREIPFGQDGSFSEDAIFTRLNADLANDLGNLVHRTLSMMERYCGGQIPSAAAIGCAVEDEPLRQAALAIAPAVDDAMARLDFSAALAAVMAVVSQANRYIESQAPWKLKREEQAARLDTVLNVLAEVLRIVAIALEPFMPSVSAAVWEQLGCGKAARRLEDATRWPALRSGQPLGTRTVLFPRPEPVVR